MHAPDVVHQDAYRAQLPRLRDELVGDGRIREVGGDRHDAALLGEGGQRRGQRARCGEHPGALGGERTGDREPDSAAGPGDDDDRAVEPEIHGQSP